MRKIHKLRDGISMADAVRQLYASHEEDEMMEPLVAVAPDGSPRGRIEQGDSVIFYNIRGEREFELTHALVDPQFTHFPRPRALPGRMATMIEYEPGLPVQVAFPPIDRIENTLGEVLSLHGIRQVRVVESEKAIHLSFFMNGKMADAFPLEERFIIPSDRSVQNFDEMPEMSISQVSEALLSGLRDEQCGFVLGNFANVDVVGHMESDEAVQRAIRAVDHHTGLVVEEARRLGCVTLVTADHGTVEKRLYPDGAVDTGHSDSPVPLILVPPEGFGDVKLRPGGSLVDVAPTVLDLMGLPVPREMSGASLIQDGSRQPGGRTGNSSSRPRVLLLILDGWGHLDKVEGNLIAQTPTPVMDRLFRTCPWTRLSAAGLAVGMPEGSVGNSECGHLHIGAGRIVPSDRVRIDEAVRTGRFFENPAFRWAMEPARKEGCALHLLGIVSFYSSHGPLDYLFALLDMARREGVGKVFIHSLLGRRGEKPESGAIYVGKVEEKTLELGVGEVVTVMGRYWAMDREENWDRIEKAYRTLVGC
jgi:2,3-bisphosphoglycerate-independent phosphoglycerate mutase